LHALLSHAYLSVSRQLGFFVISNIINN